MYTVIMDQQSPNPTKPFGDPVRTVFGGHVSQQPVAVVTPEVSVAAPQQSVDSAQVVAEANSQQVAQEAPPEQTVGTSSVTAADLPAEPATPLAGTGAATTSETVPANANDVDFNPYIEELLYEWRAGSRPFKKRNRQYFMTVLTIAILLSLILFFAGQFLPIAVVIAVAFLAYIMAVIPPQEVVYQFTTYGIRIEDELYYWEELSRFWYDDVYKQRVLFFEIDRFPFRLSLVLGDGFVEQELSSFLQLFLLHEKPPLTMYERAAEWLQKKLPLDIES